MELDTEISELKCQLQTALAELEEKSQQNYDYKRRIESLELFEKEYQQEIDTLQQKAETYKLEMEEMEVEKNQQNGTLQLKIQQLELKLINFEESGKEKDQEVERLRKELKMANCVPESDNSQLDILIKEIDDLKADKNNMLDLKQENEHLLNMNVELEKAIAFLHREQDKVNEINSSMKSQLDEANGLIQTLQEELALTKIELEGFKSKPLDEKGKGNSLFAEVNDRRLEMEKEYQVMKKAVLSIRMENGELQSQISSLKSSNVKLCQMLKEKARQQDEDTQRILINYEGKIKYLTERLKAAESEKQDLYKHSQSQQPNGESNYYKNLLQKKDKDHQDRYTHSLMIFTDNILLTKALDKKNREITILTASVMELEQDLLNLRQNVKTEDKEANLTSQEVWDTSDEAAGDWPHEEISLFDESVYGLAGLQTQKVNNGVNDGKNVRFTDNENNKCNEVEKIYID